MYSVTEIAEAIKPQSQSPNTRLAFWTAYKALADEFDKELQEKYGAGLDTSLIFVRISNCYAQILSLKFYLRQVFSLSLVRHS